MPKKWKRPQRPAARHDDAVALPAGFVAAAGEWLAGDELQAFLSACAHPSGLALRANTAKGGLAQLCTALLDVAGAWPRLPWWPEALLPPSSEAARLAAHPLARIGALYAQDPATLAAVAALDPQPGEHILDLCAAPGGKSTAIADRLSGSGLLVSNDIERSRARELQRTLERWGVRNNAVLSLAPDALAALAPGFFDRVLVDAPCSGEAMFARRAYATTDWSPRHVAGCATRQRPLLETAREMVRPDGILVYSTCTFNPHENEAVLDSYLTAHPGDVLEDAAAELGAAPGRPDLLRDAAGPRADELVRAARLWPHRSPGAGHFVVRIRVADQRNAPTTGKGRTREPEDDPATGAEIQSLVVEVAPGLNIEGAVVVRGDLAYIVPGELPPSLAEAAFVPGLCIAERRGRTWRAAHALAMALRPEDARDSAPLDDAAAAAFLSGQPVPADTAHDGLLLAVWNSYPLGWGRARRGTLTPLLPTGLRLRYPGLLTPT